VSDDVALLPYHVTIPVLGLRTRFASNEPAMLEIVDEAFGVWSALGTDDVLESDAEGVVLVRIEIAPDHPDDDLGVRDAPVMHEMSDDLRFTAWCARSVAASDPPRRLATIRATHALVADRTKFRTEMLEAVVLALLSCYDRHPVHAAAVARRGHALLLAAPSGTGKSTIAYLCHAAGLDLLGDDQVRVQLSPSLRIWGWPGRVRLLAETATALGMSRLPVELANGKRKAVIDATRDVSASRLVANDATVCVLARDGGALSLEPLPSASLVRVLDEQLAPGFDRFPLRWPEVARALTARGGWRLNLTNSPHEALPVVVDLLERAARRG
jgi:hypothetical protein